MCPWNDKFSRAATEPAFMPRPELETPDVAAFTELRDTEFKARFGDTPLARGKVSGLKRNAGTVLGNVSAVPTRSPSS